MFRQSLSPLSVLFLAFSIGLSAHAKAPSVDLKKLQEDAVETLKRAFEDLQDQSLKPRGIYFQDAVSGLNGMFLYDDAALLSIFELPEDRLLLPGLRVAVSYGLNGIKEVQYVFEKNSIQMRIPNVLVLALKTQVSERGFPISKASPAEQLKEREDFASDVEQKIAGIDVKVQEKSPLIYVIAHDAAKLKNSFARLSTDHRVVRVQLIVPELDDGDLAFDKAIWLGDGREEKNVEPDRFRRLSRDLYREGFVFMTRPSLPAPFGQGLIANQLKVRVMITLVAHPENLQELLKNIEKTGVKNMELLAGVNIVYAEVDDPTALERLKTVSGVTSVEVVR